MSSFREKIFLIGYTNHQITGGKLPSKGDCLKVLFYNMRVTDLSLNESASLVVDECLIFWKKARIPTKEQHKCREKLKKLYSEWRGLLKNKNKVAQSFKKKEEIFADSLNDLFDVAHQNALEMIRIEEDKKFLIKQREKGRPGSMLGIDRKLTGLEKRRSEREEKEYERREVQFQAPSTSAGKEYYHLLMLML